MTGGRVVDSTWQLAWPTESETSRVSPGFLNAKKTHSKIRKPNGKSKNRQFHDKVFVLDTLKLLHI
jgi:hypothetical protein